MKISIITVSHNSANTLERTLNSVANQTYQNIEHILIDGNSTDNTMSIVAKSGKHLAAVISEPDSGIYDAMNKGLSLATGDVVAFLNSDDYYSSRETIMEVAQEISTNELDILSGNVAFFRPDSEEKIIRIYNSGRFNIKRLSLGLMPAHPALFISRSVLIHAGGFKIDYKIAGDFELIARIVTHQRLRINHFPKVLVKMQIGGISTSGWRARFLMNQEILRACTENDIKTNIFKIWLRYPLKALEFL